MTSQNPFPDDPDRSAIWQMLVPRDIAAYVAGDWTAVAEDFLEAEFFGIDARHCSDPSCWHLAFPDLASYRAEWLRQAAADAEDSWAEDLASAIHRNTTLVHIEIREDRALARKEFLGDLQKLDGTAARMEWITLYNCRRVDGVWKICGFTGYLPHPGA